VLISFTIELLQMFLEARHSQVSDIICNAIGGWFGAFLYSLIQVYFIHKKNETSNLLKLNLHIVLILLTPVLWLNGTNAKGQTSNIYLSVIPVVIGCTIISTLVAYYIRRGFNLTPDISIVFMILWITLSFPIHLIKHTVLSLWIIILMCVYTLLLTSKIIRNKFVRSKYFSKKTIHFIIPCYILYIVLSMALPNSVSFLEWNSPLTLNFTIDNKINIGLILVENCFLFFLLGYLLSIKYQSISISIHSTINKIIVSGLITVFIIVIMNGFNYNNSISILELFMFFISIFYGVFLNHINIINRRIKY
jgi:hypothetical protein